ncbi:MAG: zinc ribbon domain-containing protein [Clostridia bacterium]|nr:zinc ribbon domain-containing protein [Clostridia bacterium]
MFCTKCGGQIADNEKFCHYCGNPNYMAQQNVYGANPQPVQPVYPFVQQNPASVPGSIAEKVLKQIKSPLFLTICILYSVCTLLSVINKGFPIISILFTVFLWLIFAQGRSNRVDISNMRNISGTCFAQYVLNWIGFGCFVFFGIILLAFSSMLDTPEFYEAISQNVYIESSWDQLLELSVSVIFIILGVAMLIAAVFMALINIFAIGKMHKFLKSLYQSAQMNVNGILCLNVAKGWMLAFGIISGIAALISLATSPMAFINGGCSAALYIILYIILNNFKKDLNGNITMQM